MAGWLQEGPVLITYRMHQGGKFGWGKRTQNFLAATADRESVLAPSYTESNTRIMPLDYDRSPVSDTGYSGWVQSPARPPHRTCASLWYGTGIDTLGAFQLCVDPDRRAAIQVDAGVTFGFSDRSRPARRIHTRFAAPGRRCVSRRPASTSFRATERIRHSKRKGGERDQ